MTSSLPAKAPLTHLQCAACKRFVTTGIVVLGASICTQPVCLVTHRNYVRNGILLDEQRERKQAKKQALAAASAKSTEFKSLAAAAPSGFGKPARRHEYITSESQETVRFVLSKWSCKKRGRTIVRVSPEGSAVVHDIPWFRVLAFAESEGLLNDKVAEVALRMIPDAAQQPTAADAAPRTARSATAFARATEPLSSSSSVRGHDDSLFGEDLLRAQNAAAVAAAASTARLREDSFALIDFDAVGEVFEP